MLLRVEKSNQNREFIIIFMFVVYNIINVGSLNPYHPHQTSAGPSGRAVPTETSTHSHKVCTPHTD